MLDSESRYLPVLSEPSSGPSSPQVTRVDVGQKQSTNNTAKPRRIVTNFTSQLAVATSLQHSDVIIQPTKSTSFPRPHTTAVRHHSKSPVARTLHLESSDALESSVADSVDTSSNPGSELRQLSNVKQKLSLRPRDEHGLMALSSLYTPEKYRDTMRQIYGDSSERTRTKQLTDESSDTNSCTDKLSGLAKDDTELLNRAVDVVDGNRHDLQGKYTCNIPLS